MRYNVTVVATLAKRIKLRCVPRTSIFSARGHRAENVPRKLRLAPFVLAAVLCLLLIPFLIMNALRTDPEIAEWWTRNIARGWELVIGTLSSILPISIFELLICLLILGGEYLFVRFVINLCKARFRAILIGLLSIGVFTVYVLDMYMTAMGFGYYRAEMPKYHAGANYDAKQAVVVADYFLADYNALAEKFSRDENGCVICPYTFGELADIMRDEFARLKDPYFSPYTPKAKPVANSWIMSACLITGVSFLPTGEANVNIDVPPTTVTYTMAHELAHAKGVMREGDANIISYYVLLSSKNDYLRYCGYYVTFYDFLESVSLADDIESYWRLVSSVSHLSDAEHSFTYKFWQSQPDIIGQLGEFFNNWYLESNGADNGTGSYDDGNQSGTITPVDPDTNEPIINPDTNRPVVIPVYSDLQKTYYYIYESMFGAPQAEEAGE